MMELFPGGLSYESFLLLKIFDIISLSLGSLGNGVFQIQLML